MKSDAQQAFLQEKRNSLLNRISRWRESQAVYMPGAITSPTANDNDSDDDEMAEDMVLILPSTLESEQRLAICQHRVEEYERQLRLAQIDDSLVELRNARRIRRTLLVNHRFQIAGQGRRVNTRSHSVIENIEDRIEKFARRYRSAYQALLRLDPSGDWRENFLELRGCDNRGPGKEIEEEGPGDGSYVPSWIWLANPQIRDLSSATNVDEDAADEDVNDVMRVEWATSFARMERWGEEVELLQEEMRRVVTFLEWRSLDWSTRGGARSSSVTPDIQSGLDAYARKQTAVYRNLALSFAILWRPVLISHNLDHSWATAFLKRHNVILTNYSPPAPQIHMNPNPQEPLDTNIASNTDVPFDTNDPPHANPDQPDPHPAPRARSSFDVNMGVLLDEVDPDDLSDTLSSDADDPEFDDLDFDFDFDFDLD